MSSKMIENYFIFNSKITPVSEAAILPSSSSPTIYEVIRVMSGVPLFLEKHMERLKASAKLLGCSLGPITGKVENSIHELIKINGSPNKNIKVLVCNLDKDTPLYMVYFIHSSYPSPEEYRNGVNVILLNEERNNPNAKVVNSSYKELVADALADAKAYEALLVNRDNNITEGSRSNVFFVKNSTVVTAPKDNVLVGITRVYVFELCKKLGIEIVEKPISVSTLEEIDGVFMTGTSPKILPISKIDGIHFSSAENPVINALMKGYDNILEEYIHKNRIG